MIIMGATDRRAPMGFAHIAIGLGLTLIHLIGIPVTNLSMNSARSTGPALFVGGWAMAQLWMFWAASVIGGILAERCTQRSSSQENGRDCGNQQRQGSNCIEQERLTLQVRAFAFVFLNFAARRQTRVNQEVPNGNVAHRLTPAPTVWNWIPRAKQRQNCHRKTSCQETVRPEERRSYLSITRLRRLS